MSSPNGGNMTGTKGDTSAYHKHFNPLEGGKQRRGICTKKGGKHKSEIEKNHQEKRKTTNE
eukprot:7370783-Ditylum_brightwellii.AAC.1